MNLIDLTQGDRKDVRLFDYSTELECMVLEIDRKTKRLILVPSAVAKMNELKTTQN